MYFGYGWYRYSLWPGFPDQPATKREMDALIKAHGEAGRESARVDAEHRKRELQPTHDERFLAEPLTKQSIREFMGWR